MKKAKLKSAKEHNSFMKGLLIGMGTTTLVAGMGIFLYHHYKHLKKASYHYDEAMYNYSLEGGISPDSDLASSSDPRLKSYGERMEREFENRKKEYENIEEASQNLSDMI